MFEEMINSYLARLRESKTYSVKSVILFGSVARGQAKEHSDIDIIVVASGLPEVRNRDALPPFPKPARIQDIWLTPEELEDMIIAKTGFLVDALLEGRVLLDDGTVAEAREKQIESLKRLKAKRLKSGWIIPREDLRAVISFD